MFQLSFPWVANGFVPEPNPRKRALLGLTLLLAAGCGGGGHQSERVVRGTGYRFSSPESWSVSRSGHEVQVAEGSALVSVTRYPLLRGYRTSLFEHVIPELDHAAAGLAAQQKGTVARSRTVTIAGREARSYDLDFSRNSSRLVERITFVLRGKTEYELLCRYARGGDTRACDRLLETFTLG
jgi:hypothetical protein